MQVCICISCYIICMYLLIRSYIKNIGQECHDTVQNSFEFYFNFLHDFVE